MQVDRLKGFRLKGFRGVRGEAERVRGKGVGGREVLRSELEADGKV
jgi:hypothetical protein